jgi:hypothetical protein
MAARYWVGGTATWDGTALLKWALTSGGVGGQAVPTSADTVFFDANSGANTVTIGAGTAICSTLTMTGFTGTLAFGTNSITCAGTGTVFTGATTYSVTGTPLILLTDSSATTKSISPSTPTEANAISFNISAGSGIFQTSASCVVKSLIFSGTFTGSYANNAKTIYGNLTFKTGMTITAGANGTTFAATFGTQQITSAALTLDFPITFSGTATYQLQDALTVGNTRVVSFSSGTLDLNNFVLSCGGFGSNNTNTRTLAFGTSGSITINGTSIATGWQLTGGSPTVTGTNPIVNFNAGTSAVTKSVINTTAANNISFNFLSGTDGLTFTTNFYCNNIDFTGYAGTIATSGVGSIFIYGNTKISTGMTLYTGTVTMVFSATSSKTITSNSKTLDFPVTFNGVGGTWQLQDALTVGATRIVALTTGTLDLNNNNFTCGFFNTNNSNIRGITTGTGSMYAIGNNGTVVNLNTNTNFTATGTLNFYCTYSGSVGTRAIQGFGNVLYANFYVNAGTDAFQVVGSRLYNNLDFTGFGGSLTVTGSAAANISGNFVSPTVAGASTIANALGFNFVSSGSKTVSFSGLTYDMPFSFATGTYVFQDAMTLGATNGTLTFSSGTLQFQAGTTNTVASFITSGTTNKFLRSTTTGTQATLSQATGTVTVTYLNIQDSNATGGAIFDATALSNTNSGNNTGWLFTNGNFFLLF